MNYRADLTSLPVLVFYLSLLYEMSTQGGEYFLDVQIYCGFQEEMARFIYDKVDPLHTVAHSKIPNAKHGVE